jgi:hypothetical protein
VKLVELYVCEQRQWRAEGAAALVEAASSLAVDRSGAVLIARTLVPLLRDEVCLLARGARPQQRLHI